MGHYLIYQLANAQILQLVLVLEKNVPFQEQQFLSDQRFARKMYIGSIDIAITKRNKKTLQRKMENKRRSTTKTFLFVNTADGIESSSTSESSEEFDSDSIPL